MDLLVDTHAIIWFITDSGKLPINSKKIIKDTKNNCYVSLATYWEIGIKHSLGRLDLKTDLESIFNLIEDTGFELLPITTNHILKNADLEFHHQDPFDRIIIAQAIIENLTIVSKDNQFDKYKIKLVWEK
ncbi:MAG: type II toxin-antitoxin system VapC family toxin [Bacteroidales bacterium]|nr:type II toxin-antitoxin system VapC family toxin [Bacteroidales bacterium]